MSVFGPLAPLRAKPIPAPPENGARGYRDLPIAFDGAANREPLVALSGYGVRGENFYAQPRNPPYYEVIPGSISALYLRQGAAERLAAANARLGEAGLELFVFDAWRPQAVQIYFYDRWLPAELRRRKPHLSAEQLGAEVQNYWAAPSASADTPSPHATGGALDLTVRWRGGDPLWMGSLFDDASALSHTARFEGEISPDGFSFSDEEARANRRLLYWLMTEAGFASNPSEWWHFSFGDQMWAKLRGEPAALYAGTEASSFRGNAEH
ncbi:MAG: M15 family metallopeptidase [Hyphomonadaceae bacterium]